MFTGANVLGALDIVFGTAATLTAALCTRRLARVRLRGLPVAAAVPPVLINAVVVGAELAWAFGPRTFAGFLLQAGGVALGQLFSCFALGLPLVRIIEKTPALRAWFRDCTFFPLVPRQKLILSARMAEPTARGCFAFLSTKE